MSIVIIASLLLTGGLTVALGHADPAFTLREDSTVEAETEAKTTASAKQTVKAESTVIISADADVSTNVGKEVVAEETDAVDAEANTAVKAETSFFAKLFGKIF